MVKNLRNEIKSIKWTKPSDVVKQTLFTAAVVITTAAALGLFDAFVQLVISKML